MPELNADPSRPVVMHTEAMPWEPSPSPTVWRKRLELCGPPEAGRVTSVVLYERGSTFPAHDHPDGEEILVLSGTFSDEHGDYPAGTLLLNPEGFRHAPFSRDGCVLFVKLRQYGGAGRRHVIEDTGNGGWRSVGRPGVEILPLYRQRGFPEVIRLMRLAPDASLPPHEHHGGAEAFVLDGGFEDAGGRYGRGDWIRYPHGSRHAIASPRGCRLYLRLGHLAP
jgi:anti-sigma factor ChrR (cupin superfamily)